MLAVIALFSMQACFTSLQPLATYDKIITDNRITGNWTYEGDVYSIMPLRQSNIVKEMQQSNKAGLPFAITGDPKKDSLYFDKLYLVSFSRDSVSYNMAAGLIRLGGHLFMDLYPIVMNDPAHEGESPVYDFNMDYLPGLTMAKVEIRSNAEITLRFVNGQFIKEQVKAGRIKIKHETNELFDTFLITASSEELQLFLTKYATDKRIYTNEVTIVQKKRTRS